MPLKELEALGKGYFFELFRQVVPRSVGLNPAHPVILHFSHANADSVLDHGRHPNALCAHAVHSEALGMGYFFLTLTR